MENLPNNNDDFDFKKLLEEAKLDDLSNDFEKQFASIQKKALIRKIGFYTVLVLIGSWAGYYMYSETEKAATNPIKTENVITDTILENTNVNVQNTIAEKLKTANEISKKREIEKKEELVQLEVSNVVSNTKAEPLIEKKDNVSTIKNTETIPEAKTNKPVETENKCANIHILPSVQVIAACGSKADGKIHITSVSGGQKPFKYRLDDFNYETSSQFKDLQEGTYSLQVMDANGCESGKKQIELNEERCPDESDLVYSLSRDNELKIPIVIGDQVKILDAKGNLVYQEKSELDFVLFNSTTIRNQAVKEGFYLLFVTKSNGKHLKYEITVLP
jgi:hypothetical protein